MKLVFAFLILVGMTAIAGILPTSRGGTGAAIVPVQYAPVISTASGFTLASSLKMPAGYSVVIAANSTTASGGEAFKLTAGTTMASPGPSDSGTIQNDGSHLWWVDSSGANHRLDN